MVVDTENVTISDEMADSTQTRDIYALEHSLNLTGSGGLTHSLCRMLTAEQH